MFRTRNPPPCDPPPTAAANADAAAASALAAALAAASLAAERSTDLLASRADLYLSRSLSAPAGPTAALVMPEVFTNC